MIPSLKMKWVSLFWGVWCFIINIALFIDGRNEPDLIIYALLFFCLSAVLFKLDKLLEGMK